MTPLGGRGVHIINLQTPPTGQSKLYLGSLLAFLKEISQQDNQKAFDVNEIREKQCVEWLKSKKKGI